MNGQSAATVGAAPDRQLLLPDKTHQEFQAAVEEHPTLRVEYLNGDIVMTPARSPHHQMVVANLLLLLGQHAKQKELGLVLPAPVDVVLAREAQITQPDLIFVGKSHRAKLLARSVVNGAPDLVIEILSPSTARMDRKVKLLLYAQHGVGEYWIVDPEDRSVEVYVLDGNSFRIGGIFMAGDAITAGKFADAGVTAESVFAE
jgi:Uma2 family endonuclease